MSKIPGKILSAVITIIIVSLLVFLAFSIIPGDPAVAKLGTFATEEKLNALRESMGLNRPLPVRYINWLTGLIRGDLGTSISYSMPVSRLIGDKIPVTLILTVYSFAIMLIVSVSVALYAAWHEGSAIDKAIQILNQITMSIPPFFAGILITLVLGLGLKLFTPGGYISYKRDLPGFLYYMFFPALSIAIPKSAMAINLLYTSLVMEGKKDYARTAYSRGNDSRKVFRNHLLKNAAIPVITFLGMALADMIAGSIVIEQVFSIPGLGRILLTSIQNRDYPVTMAIVMCIAALVLISNLLVDVLYRIVDPRLRHE